MVLAVLGQLKRQQGKHSARKPPKLDILRICDGAHSQTNNSMQWNVIKCKTMQYDAIQCYTLKYHEISYTTMQDHAISHYSRPICITYTFNHELHTIYIPYIYHIYTIYIPYIYIIHHTLYHTLYTIYHIPYTIYNMPYAICHITCNTMLYNKIP